LFWAVVGDTGLFGSSLVERLAENGEPHIGLNRSNFAVDDPRDLADRIQNLASEPVDFVVNAIGYTSVDMAESNPQTSQYLNVEVPTMLSSAALHLGSQFIHISTDYVFDGELRAPYGIEDSPNPQTEYGRSKILGEQAVQESGADYQIFRTAWLYGANGGCFPKTVKRLLGQEGHMKVVQDQFGQPTWAKDLADLVIAHSKLTPELRPRLVHATASGRTSWFEFAREIANSLGYDADGVITPVSSEDFPAAARRPKYSVLDNQNLTGLVIGDWRERWQEAASEVLA
jgi:dTDP-4-dehydrorhamnose reductase